MASVTTQPRRSVELTRYVPLPADVAVAILAGQPERVVGSHFQAPMPPGEAHTDLGIDLGRRQLTRDVRVGLGPILQEDDAVALTVWWEDAEHPQLFPTFDGGLEIRSSGEGTELRLVGSYQPPLGAFGRFADGLFGHRIVSASLEAFLTDAADRLVASAGP